MDFFDYFYHNVFRNEFKTQECEAGSATHSVRAGKMIKKGQEVTISYLGSKDGTREDRREDLLKTWYTALQAGEEVGGWLGLAY